MENMKYISEYILKLQIQQHSLLTRKVFYWHNSSVQVFFSGSSSKLDNHWIIIKVRSSLDHHQNLIITRSSSKLDHHKSWIITGSSSKIDHHWIIIKYGSSLYCHQSWIIIKAGSSLAHHHWHYSRYLKQMVLSLNSIRRRNFYRSISFSCSLWA